VIVLRSTFTGIISKADGGALCIGFTSSFTVNTSTFSSCTSQNGNGGAIACLSGGGSALVSFYGVNFTGNSALNGKGNDFCDVSTSTASISAYSINSFSALLSTSLASRFYHISADISFDCFFSESCQLSDIYINSILGSDFFICGGISLPCSSFDFSISAALFPATFYVNSGDYLVNKYNITSKAVSITGQTAGEGGNVIVGNVPTYPVFILTCSESYSYLFYVYYSPFVASYLKFSYDSTASSSHRVVYGLFFVFCFFKVFFF
jgi:hypothetical protein